MTGESFSLHEVCHKLKISQATLKNWERQGLVNIHNNQVLLEEYERLQKSLKNEEHQRLGSRANRQNSRKHFYPKELLKQDETLKALLPQIHEHVERINELVFIIACGYLEKQNVLRILPEALTLHQFPVCSKQEHVYALLYNFWKRLDKQDLSLCASIQHKASALTSPFSLGAAYQYLLHTGAKASTGAYYTAEAIRKEAFAEIDLGNKRIYDPCCGSGNFLIHAALQGAGPEQLFGADLDAAALFLCKTVLTAIYPQYDFSQQFFLGDSLLFSSTRRFDILVTNPPWGARIAEDTLKLYKSIYNRNSSNETFSLFLEGAIMSAHKDAEMLFVLPHSVTVVRNHKPIRTMILQETWIKRLSVLKNRFSGVQSVPVLLHLKKGFRKRSSTLSFLGKQRIRSQRNFLDNPNFMMDVFNTQKDRILLKKIEQESCGTLAGSADFFLGIVTGNNAKHIQQRKSENPLERIIRGQDIEAMKIHIPALSLPFSKDAFQQCKEEALYRQKKLVYRFIYKKPVFAVDSLGLLPLNSVNCVVPYFKNWPMEVFAVLFNSAVYTYYFQHKFFSVKVLRQHIENFPLPALSKSQIDELLSLCQRSEVNTAFGNLVDDFVFRVFDFSTQDREHVLQENTVFRVF